MNHAEFGLFLQALSHSHLVQASECIEEALELQVGDTLVCVEWNEQEQRLELTVPLPDLLDEQDPDSLRLRLYRALFAWQWIAAAHSQHPRFAEIGGKGQIVGLASIAAEGIRCAEHLYAAVASAHDGLQAAWLQLGAQVLSEELSAAAPRAAPWPAP